MQVDLLYFEDCPNWKETAAHLRVLGDEIDELAVTATIIDTPELAERHGFRGSPSLLIDGIDPFATQGDPIGLSCRIYQTPDGPAGSPTIEQLRRILKAL